MTLVPHYKDGKLFYRIAEVDDCIDYALNSLKKEGIKYDQQKPRLGEMIVDFKEPLQELCKVWEFGANKYEKSNWKKLENGVDRYTNALLRHLVAEDDNLYDDESKLLHAAHIAFNALARLYFIKQELNKND